MRLAARIVAVLALLAGVQSGSSDTLNARGERAPAGAGGGPRGTLGVPARAAGPRRGGPPGGGGRRRPRGVPRETRAAGGGGGLREPRGRRLGRQSPRRST